jgi:hypothetical protein
MPSARVGSPGTAGYAGDIDPVPYRALRLGIADGPRRPERGPGSRPRGGHGGLTQPIARGQKQAWHPPPLRPLQDGSGTAAGKGARERSYRHVHVASVRAGHPRLPSPRAAHDHACVSHRMSDHSGRKRNWKPREQRKWRQHDPEARPSPAAVYSHYRAQSMPGGCGTNFRLRVRARMG